MPFTEKRLQNETAGLVESQTDVNESASTDNTPTDSVSKSCQSQESKNKETADNVSKTDNTPEKSPIDDDVGTEQTTTDYEPLDCLVCKPHLINSVGNVKEVSESSLPEERKNNWITELTEGLENPYQPVNIRSLVCEQRSIPAELRKIKQWLCHNKEKEPMSGKGRYRVSINDRNEWMSCEEAIAGMKEYHDGISFVLSEVNPIWCIDIDHCIDDDGNIASVVMMIIKKISSYTEISLSGKGIHIFLKAEKNRKSWIKRKEGCLGNGLSLEIYSETRHICFTGYSLRGFKEIRYADKELVEIYDAFMNPITRAKNEKSTDSGLISEPPPEMTEDEVINHIKNEKSVSKAAAALFNGDFSGYEKDPNFIKADGNIDRSKVDYSVLNKICFYSINPTVIRNILSSSPLKRDKWYTMRGNITYLDYIIGEALRKSTTHYRPSKKGDQPEKQLSIQRLDDEFHFGYDDLSCIELNDIALSDFFGKNISDIVAYVPEQKTFYLYNRIFWEAANSDCLMSALVKKFINRCMKITHHEVNELERKLKENKEDKDEIERVKANLSKANNLYSYYRQKSTLSSRDKIIRDIKDVIMVEYKIFDNKPNLINMLNGTLNLDTLDLQPHNPKDYITQCTNCAYNPNAKCPRFTQFLNEITLNRPHVKKYIQKICGYFLYGKNRLHAMFIAHGKTTRNGKTTLFLTIRRILNTYANDSSVELLTKPSGKSSGDAKPDILALEKKRFIYLAESEKRAILQAALIKQITGGDNLTARGLFSNVYTTFQCYAKMVIACNNLPKINDLSLINSGRLWIIPFDRFFKEEERDITLEDQFSEPEAMEAIFLWLLEGFNLFRQEGLKQIEESKKALDNYEKLYNYTGDFVEKFLRLPPENDKQRSDRFFEKASSVWDCYKEYCKDSNIRLCTRKDFLDDLKSFGIQIFTKSHQDYLRVELISKPDLFGTAYENKEERLNRQYNH